MKDADIVQNLIAPNENFIWDTTGSIADIRINPLYWILTVITLGLFIIILFYKRVFKHYILTDQRLIIITGILGKHIDEVELLRVVDSKTNQSFCDRWVDIGDIILDSTDRTGQIVMEKVPHPYYLRDTLRQAYANARKNKDFVMLESST